MGRLASETIRLLHHRRPPWSKGNIDHVAVAPTGVYVIDAKKYPVALTSRSTVGCSDHASSGF